MGTETVDQAGAETGTEAAEAKRDGETVGATEKDAKDRATPASEDTGGVDDGRLAEDAEDADVVDAVEESRPSGIGLGAGAVVSAALGLVSLSGGWIGTVASARQTLIGQLETSSSASVAHQVQAVYGDAWQATALWAGLFALAALVTGVVVLARPAFGAPGRVQAPWIKSVAWAGVALGVIGLLLAVLKYTDALLGLPSAG
ncbi:hypothetical protein ACFYO5_32820 [Streptomyces sp. NPDC006259]|uniref:hypothetical protein n=1 Tax=Streptomyces sp. NPDC006259 TaxID=3364740 RepID=UPI0036A7AEF3